MLKKGILGASFRTRKAAAQGSSARDVSAAPKHPNSPPPVPAPPATLGAAHTNDAEGVTAGANDVHGLLPVRLAPASQHDPSSCLSAPLAKQLGTHTPAMDAFDREADALCNSGILVGYSTNPDLNNMMSSCIDILDTGDPWPAADTGGVSPQVQAVGAHHLHAAVASAAEHIAPSPTVGPAPRLLPPATRSPLGAPSAGPPAGAPSGNLAPAACTPSPPDTQGALLDSSAASSRASAAASRAGPMADPRDGPDADPEAEAEGIASVCLLAQGRRLPEGMPRREWALSDYRITAKVAHGPSSRVYKGTCNLSGEAVAFKVYDLRQWPGHMVHMLAREVAIHAALDHPHIVQLYGAFKEGHRLVLVMEHGHRGDLFTLFRDRLHSRMTEPQLAPLVLQPLLQALVYLHARGVCHRDIKPENIVLSADWSIRLADFGASINMSEERAVTRTGTVSYMAPEVERCPLKRTPEENKDDPSLAYTTAADVWSVGVLAFEMLLGFPPFAQQQERYSIHGRAVQQPQHLLFPAFVSPGARDFITSALAPRPGDRPTAAQLLAHPWLCARVQSSRARGKVTGQPAPAPCAP